METTATLPGSTTAAEPLSIATSAADAEAAEAVEQHHAQMAGALELKGEALVSAARAGDSQTFRRAQDALVGWCRSDLVPHALAEEGTLYAAAAEHAEAKLLVAAMLAEHAEIVSLIEQVEQGADVVAVVGAVGALRRLFAVHLAKENEQILPLLVASPSTSVAELLDGMHEILGGHAEHADDADAHGASAGHGCQCGEKDADGFPELDVQTIPHAIRHATLFGALDALTPGAGVILRATHDPVPLLRQLHERAPGAYQVDYLERGPEQWRLQFVRT